MTTALRDMLSRGEELRKADEAVIVLYEALRAAQRSFDRLQDPGWQLIEEILNNTRDLADEAVRRERLRLKQELLDKFEALDMGNPYNAEALAIARALLVM